MVNVVCAVIYNKYSEVLITQRGIGELRGKWEFPGGKVEAGETHEQSLVRELSEELNITTKIERLILTNSVIINSNPYFLYFYLANIIDGEIKLTVHNSFKWVKPKELPNYDILDGDLPMVKYLIESQKS